MAKKRFDVSKYHLPKTHQPAMEVPQGGSMCANCVLYSPEGGRHGSCVAPEYKIYYGTRLLPVAPDRFCSDWYQPSKSDLGQVMKLETHEGVCADPATQPMDAHDFIIVTAILCWTMRGLITRWRCKVEQGCHDWVPCDEALRKMDTPLPSARVVKDRA